MNINFELYKVFYEVAKCGSISKGAEKLLISQPAVSQSIQTLENELGGKLFTRTPRGVILTNEGCELYNYIKEGMNYFINGTNKFMSLKNLEVGVVNIGATTTISENYLIPYLSKFHSLYPNVKINILNELTENLFKELRNGNLDIVFSSIPNNIKDFKFEYICDLNYIFVSNKKDDFLDLNNIILQKKPSLNRTNFDEYMKNNNFSYSSKMEVVSHNLLVKLIENGFGCGFVTKEFIENKLNKTLFEINTNIKIPSIKLGFAIKKDVYPTFSTRKFIELLKKDDF